VYTNLPIEAAERPELLSRLEGAHRGTGPGGLVGDRGLGERILGDILAELQRTRRVLEIIYGGSLAEKRPHVHRRLTMREKGLRILHDQQIELLRRWRTAQANANLSRAEDLLVQLLLKINAVASRLGTTG
jgi:phosphoenolpyruvate carboxylase